MIAADSGKLVGMTVPRGLYQRWILELWAGAPVATDLVRDEFVGHWPDREVRGPAELEAIIAETRNMFGSLTFAIEIGPLVDGDLMAGRWIGRGVTADGDLSFTANDIHRVSGERVVEYWTGTSAG